jgi:hypothetical protein
MPTMARPDVDVLDGPDHGDHRRPGADGRERSLVRSAPPPTPTPCCGSCSAGLGEPLHRSPQAFSFNVASVSGGGASHHGEGRKDRREADLLHHRRHVPSLRGDGSVSDFDLTALYDDSKSLNEGRHDDSRLLDGGLVRADLPRLRVLRPRQAGRGVHQEGTRRTALQGATKDQDRRHQPDLPRADSVRSRSRFCRRTGGDAAAHPGLRRPGDRVRHLPRVRRDPTERRCALVQDRRHQHRRRVRDADQRPGRVGRLARRAVGCAAAEPGCARPSIRSWRSASAT